jgi:hypothetical protein
MVMGAPHMWAHCGRQRGWRFMGLAENCWGQEHHIADGSDINSMPGHCRGTLWLISADCCWFLLSTYAKYPAIIQALYPCIYLYLEAPRQPTSTSNYKGYVGVTGEASTYRSELLTLQSVVLLAWNWRWDKFTYIQYSFLTLLVYTLFISPCPSPSACSHMPFYQHRTLSSPGGSRVCVH